MERPMYSVRTPQKLACNSTLRTSVPLNAEGMFVHQQARRSINRCSPQNCLLAAAASIVHCQEGGE